MTRIGNIILYSLTIEQNFPTVVKKRALIYGKVASIRVSKSIDWQLTKIERACREGELAISVDSTHFESSHQRWL